MFNMKLETPDSTEKKYTDSEFNKLLTWRKICD